MLRRLLSAVLVIFIVSILVFVFVNVLPGGDVIERRLGGSLLTRDEIQAIREEEGLSRSLPTQYWDWVSGVVQGDFGTSDFNQIDVWDELENRIPATLELGGFALILIVIIGVPSGIISAITRNSVTDYASRLWANVGLSVPDFFLGLIALLVLSKYLGWTPPIGYVKPWDDLGKNLEQIWLPALILGVRGAAASARMTRSAMLEVLGADYIRTARAKGLKEHVVVLRHAARNAMIPVVTIIGLQAGFVIAGAIVIEFVFNIPGMGLWLITSVSNRDFVVLQAIVLVFALSVTFANLVVDLSYTWLDPRIRY
ncbi:MAG: ABC transporter permease [Dehalococcoidia bacterium]